MNGEIIIAKAKSHLGESGTQTWNAYKLAKGQAWCCQFVWRVFNECGASKLFYGGSKTAYCPSARSWCKTNLKKVPVSQAQAGDIIFFDWNKNGVSDHIGLVEYVSGGVVHTIEGNTGSPARVRQRTRSSYIQDIWRPKYEPPKPQDYIVKVDGEWGYHTCLATQYVLGGLTLDGVLGKATIKAIQKKVGTTADGAWGKNTSRAMSKFLGIAEQTTRSKALITAWQKWLNQQINAKVNPR